MLFFRHEGIRSSDLLTSESPDTPKAYRCDPQTSITRSYRYSRFPECERALTKRVLKPRFSFAEPWDPFPNNPK